MAETVRQAMTPAETAQIEEWLAELSVLVVRRPDDEFGDALRLTAYAQRLADYPADVARAALLEHRWKFWPAWEELAAVCDKLVKARRVMLHALETADEKPAPEPRERVSPQSAADILAEMGFDEKRTEALRFAPDARHVEDAVEARENRKTRPHWTETVDPDGPEMQALRRVRDENQLVQAAREAQAREEAERKAQEAAG